MKETKEPPRVAEPQAPALLSLRVAEASPADAGRGIIRLDPADLDRLAAKIGEIVMIDGKKSAVARVLPAYPEFRGAQLIQMDGVLRANAGVSLDERVNVHRVACPPARSIVLAPAGPGANAFRDVGQPYLAHLLSGLPALAGNQLRIAPFGARPRDFAVLKTEPAGVVLPGPNTRVYIQGAEASASPPAGPIGVSYEDIGGLHRETQRIREMIELPLKFPEVFERLGIDPPRGVLLTGPPGCGKTLVARAVAHETQAWFTAVSGPEIMHKFYGESEAHLRNIFEQAARHAPAIIFIDEIDGIAPKREDLGGEKQVERRVVAQLLALLDGLESRGQVVVIGATNLPHSLDPALRRPGRFDREITIGVPDRRGRREILQVHTRGMPLAESVDVDHLAEVTHGFVGADLEALCREAAMHALRRLLPRVDFASDHIPYEDLLALHVEMQDFVAAAQEVEPSGLRELTVEVPNVRWDQVGGLGEARRALQEAVEWPLSHPDLVRELGARPPRGILLAGPPGTGKTLLARAVATESGVNFIAIGGPALISRYVGESERAVRDIFRKARAAAPCIIFLDEVDGLLPRRGSGGGDAMVSERVLSQFLSEFDGITGLQGVVLLGATNRREALDSALLRPGRFDVIIDLALPDPSHRFEILSIHGRGRPLQDDVDLRALSKKPTEGMSGADLEAILSRAGWIALREYLESASPGGAPRPSISSRHVNAAVDWLKAQKKEIAQCKT